MKPGKYKVIIDSELKNGFLEQVMQYGDSEMKYFLALMFVIPLWQITN